MRNRKTRFFGNIDFEALFCVLSVHPKYELMLKFMLKFAYDLEAISDRFGASFRDIPGSFLGHFGKRNRSWKKGRKDAFRIRASTGTAKPIKEDFWW